MKYKELCKLLKPFSEADDIPEHVVQPFEALYSFFLDHKQDDETIFQIGSKTIKGLKDIEGKIISSWNFIVSHKTELEEAYLKEQFGKCLSDYSKNHLNDKLLYVNQYVIENGRIVDIADNHKYILNNSFVAWLLKDYEGEIDGPSEAAAAERLEEENDYYSLLRDDITVSSADEGKNVTDDNPWGDSLGIPVTNPLFSAKVEEVRTRFRNCLDLIAEYLKYLARAPRNYDMFLDYSIPLAETINGEIFEEDIDGSSLADYLFGDAHCSLTIREGKTTKWIHILKLLAEYGPEFCRKDDWALKSAEKIGIDSRTFNKRSIKDDMGRLCNEVKELLQNINNKIVCL